MRVVEFIKNRWFRVVLATALIFWTIITVAWLITADGVPLYVLGHAVYDLVIESVLAVSLWMDIKRG